MLEETIVGHPRVLSVNSGPVFFLLVFYEILNYAQTLMVLIAFKGGDGGEGAAKESRIEGRIGSGSGYIDFVSVL